MISSGCCGFSKGMKDYFKNFRVVEVQKTFYKPPQRKILEKWRRKAPEDFEFTVKAWQLITHPPRSPTYMKAGIEIPDGKRDRYGGLNPTREVLEAWQKTRDVCKILRAKVTVIQCPKSFLPTHENIENMKAFFGVIERDNLEIAWEPRGEAWRDKIIKELCKELELIHCVDPFARYPAFLKDTAYFRLHGSPPGKRMYYYRYTYKDQEELLKKCRDLESRGLKVYCLFNNLSMYEDALRLRDMVKGNKKS